MKSKKYIIFSSLSLTVLMLLSGCADYLDLKPLDRISDAQTIFDKTSSEAAVRGVYSALGGGGYYGTTFQSIGYLSGDNVQWTGSQSQVQEFINHKVNADNSTVAGAWSAIYQTILRANHVIQKIPLVPADPTFSTTFRNHLTGEGYFVRGLAYFDLARTWGGVPIITQPTQTPGDNIGILRSTQAEVYAQAIKDLDAAELLLSEPTTVLVTSTTAQGAVPTDRYRATKKTVWALKSRFYLYQSDWAKAESYATLIIGNTTNYRLIAPYSSWFASNARGTVESILETWYNGTTETNGHRGQWQPQQNGGTRQWAPNDAFVALINNATIGGNRNTSNVLVAKDNQNRNYGNLYYRNPGSDPSYIIRIAELFLIRAEARARQNLLTLAADDLNAVRTRAGLGNTTAATQADLLLAIENERRVEFAFESDRWFDLVRTGRAGVVLGITDPRRYLMPIPAAQRLLDPSLTQNDPY